MLVKPLYKCRKIFNILKAVLLRTALQCVPTQQGRFLGLLVDSTSYQLIVPDKVEYIKELVTVALESTFFTRRQSASITRVTRPTSHVAAKHPSSQTAKCNQGSTDRDSSWDRSFAMATLIVSASANQVLATNRRPCHATYTAGLRTLPLATAGSVLSPAVYVARQGRGWPAVGGQEPAVKAAPSVILVIGPTRQQPAICMHSKRV